MFDSVGWGEILVLVVAGLFILGPERLPAAAAWLGKTIRQVKDYASGAREQLRGELGSEFDELRKPLEELRGLRDLNPRTAARKALWDDVPTNGNGAPNRPSMTKQPPGPDERPARHPALGPEPERLTPGERPPIDPDAT